MLSRQRKTNSRNKNQVRFERCRVCGEMINCITGSFIITANNIFKCDDCYRNKEWDGSINFDADFEYRDLSRKMK